MIEGELRAISQAWAFQKEAGVVERPVSIDKYVRALGAEVRVRDDLRDDEAGQVIEFGSRRIIVVNGRHSQERQRFTVLHEIAHIKLDLPSSHSQSTSVEQLLGYSKRPREEILCDIFAAECLLPRPLFQSDLLQRDCSLAAIQELADLYQASLATTGSRLAAYSAAPCCWVLADDKYIRYASCSQSLRDAGFSLKAGIEIPKGSVLRRLRDNTGTARPGVAEIVPAHVWVHNDCESVDEFSEAALASTHVRQGVALLVAEIFEQGERVDRRTDDDDVLLRELDGILQFPGKRKRR